MSVRYLAKTVNFGQPYIEVSYVSEPSPAVKWSASKHKVGGSITITAGTPSPGGSLKLVGGTGGATSGAGEPVVIMGSVVKNKPVPEEDATAKRWLQGTKPVRLQSDRFSQNTSRLNLIT